MGIPSYYRQLCQATPGLVEKLTLYNNIRWCNSLWIDFNCIIYHCMNRPGMRTFEECGGSNTAYEETLIDEVLKYLEYIIMIGRPRDTVYIAVDGVVPAAKRRQQRLRRCVSESSGGWNKNAITPGTKFMERLQERLELFICAREAAPANKIRWRLSGHNEAGEGEHKIMGELRAMKAIDNSIHFIYGLDADLILLSMLNCATYHPTESFFLYREDMKDGQIVYDNAGKETLTVFSIDVLMKYIAERRPRVLDLQDTWRAWMIDYIFIMSLLGNDFLPSYITLSFKDDGHAHLLRLLNGLWDKGLRLVEHWDYSKREMHYERGGEGWKWIWGRLKEETDEVRYGKLVEKKKAMVQKRRGRGEAMCSVVETSVYDSKDELMADWKDRIYIQFSGVSGSARYIQRQMTTWYKKTLNWVLQYYFGFGVDTDWYYPSYITPFCDDLEYYWDRCKDDNKRDVYMNPSMSEQLALVLPGKDMGLIQEPSLRGFNKSVWFPTDDGGVKYHEFMKWSEWERIPKIPSPLLSDLRIWNKEY